MYRYSWPDWFPYPKSLVRGFAVLITFLSAYNSNLYLLADEEKFTAVFLVILFSQIPFFMMYHWLFGIGLMFSRSTLFFQYKNTFLANLIEGVNAFLVTCLLQPFVIFFEILINPGDLLAEPTDYYYFYYYRADFRESVAFVVLGLIASYFYHAGNVFWSWLNHHNKRLNQKYYTKKKQEKLSGTNPKRLTASKREIQIKSLERSLRKSGRDNEK